MAEALLIARSGSDLSRIESAALFLRRHQRVIMVLQWMVVALYATLVIVPAFMPIPAEEEHLWGNFRLFAQFCFWGIWWPGVMVATLLLGRVWCGLLCPEGHLTEWASRHGQGRAIPRWLRWTGWPFLSFVCTTVYGQLVSVYEYPEAALLVLGGSSIAAMVVGWFYGRGKRVWCRYLCPASGVFALLAKLAPQRYVSDRYRWDHYHGTHEPYNCAVLVDVHRINSASECHACGRCAGQRDAVSLKWRSPFAEILDPSVEISSRDALLVLFGLLGIATAAFQWSMSPLFVWLKIQGAEWLVNHDYYWPLADNAPWWLLTHHPEVNDLFTWLDGALVLVYLLAGGGLLGALLSCGPLLSQKVMRHPFLSWQRLTMALLPLAAASIILGLSMLTISHLRAEHVALGWLPGMRGFLLATGAMASVWLGWRMIRPLADGEARAWLATLCLSLPVVAMTWLWWQVFFVW